MDCPHCQKELPENHGTAWCPYCGKDLSLGENLPKNKLGIQPLPTGLFFIFLLAPAAVSFLALLLHVEFIAVVAGIFGSLISGIVCATLYMRSLNVTGFRQVVLYVVFIAAFCFLSFFISGLGCAAGGGLSSM